MAHDEDNNCNVGDTVKIMETRPLSKSKCWRMVEIIERAKVSMVQQESRLKSSR